MRRFDRAIRLDKGVLTTQGFLKAPAFFTRTGVFLYRKADGSTMRELRHPDDVFNQESLNTLKMAPLTDKHPTKFVNSDNAKDLAVGWASENIVVTDNKLVGGTLVVSDKKAIDKVDKGTVELSCGYEADLVEEKGTYDGEPYDYRQTNIRYNHVALVDRGRAGPQVRIRLDGDAEMVDEDTTDLQEVPVKKIKIGDKEYSVSQEVADAFEAYASENKKMSDAFEELKKKKKDEGDQPEVKKEIEDLKTKNSTLQAKVDTLDASLKQKKDGPSKEEIQKMVSERKKLESVAFQVLGSEAKLDASDADLMKAVITKRLPTLDLKDKDEAYVKTCFETIAHDSEGYEARRSQLAPSKDERKDSEFDAAAAQKKAHAEAKESYKQPLAASKK